MGKKPSDDFNGMELKRQGMMWIIIIITIIFTVCWFIDQFYMVIILSEYASDIIN